MITILTSIISLFLTVPVLGFILIYFVVRAVTKNSKKSVHRALDYSTILFILAVHFLIASIWGKSFFWLIILIMILTAMLFTVVHWKFKGEIVLNKVIKGFWRFNFLLFFIAYFALLIFGLIERAIAYSTS